MKLRKKTLILIGMTSIIIIMVLQVTSQRVLLNSFATLENADTKQNVERVLSALSSDMSNLETNAHDWAAWDDTYIFIQDKNEEYIEFNLASDTLSNLKLNLMLFMNSSGEFVFGRFFDLENEEFAPIPESIMEQLTPDNKLLQHQDVESSITGFMLLPENPLLLASHPILTSSNEGPILGTLIMGYYLDDDRVAELAQRTHLSIEIQRLDDQQKPADFQEAISSLSEQDPIFVKPLNSKSVAGYTLIEDILGVSRLALRVDLPRSIYEQGKTTITYFMLLLLAISITFTAVIMLLLEKTVLSRLAQLNTSINYITSQGNLLKRVSVKGKEDELTDLADEINGMLTTINQSQDKLQITNEKLNVVGKLTRHDVRNKLATIANNLYLAKNSLANNAGIKEYLDNIDLVINQVRKILDFEATYEKVGIEELVYLDVHKIVQEAAMLHGTINVKLVNECKGLTVLADSLLRQVFFNLLDNSLKHGEKVSQVRVYYEAGEDTLKLTYEDDGVGVPETEKALLFKEGHGKNTGYGLYLMRKICDAYGWTIQETGKQGEGVKFVMTIPKISKKQKINYYVK